MSTDKTTLILHPARFQILQALSHDALTTQELHTALPAIPKPSLYRHLKTLLEAGIVEVAEMLPGRGGGERRYRLAQAPRLGPEDVAGLSNAEHFRHFITYIATLLQGFADYLDSAPKHGFLAEHSGYTEIILYANAEELEAFGQAFKQLLAPLVQNGPGAGRHRHKLAVIAHPVGECKT